MMKHPYSRLMTLGTLFLGACNFPEEHAVVHRHGDPIPTVQAGEIASVPGMSVSEHYAGFCTSRDYPHTFNVWKDESLLPSEGTKKVVIRLGQQRGLFLVNGKIAMDFPVCTGRKGYATPTGTYRVLEKDANHHSNLYDCPMPYFMRLTYCGIGLHVGDIYRVPASHGCIRLPRTACEPIFRHLPRGSEVEILP